MTNPSQLESIFFAALEKQLPAERSAFLHEACADDDELCRRVERMLAAQADAGSFLELPALEVQRTALFPTIAEGPGTVIGPYKLLQQIGEGGMGVVFMAEQTEPIQRTVALKIIKPGMDTRQVIVRFEAERQALAMMDHPNIAKVLDAGTTGEGARDEGRGSRSGDEVLLALGPRPSTLDHSPGRPYFVMELVKGVPITRYCDDKHLPLRVRLELFTQVCQAVQHAHQKGIIHRDLKPSNVLVAEYDDRAVPKVIDFGVAKATAQRLTERTMFTEFGQVLGTLEYMSPEQAKLNQLDIDTRSDIYSLGVLLYELLAGSTPFERKRLHETAFDEILRIIREEEPQKPSTRLSSLTSRERAIDSPPLAGRAGEGVPSSLASIAASRRTEPARLSKELQGELDWIVMKALEKDRNRRYETASSFAADILHYLSDEPVTAAAPTRLYRVRKFVGRNKGLVIASVAVLAGLIVGIVGMTIGLISQSRQRATAERERAEAQLNLAAALQSQDSFAEAEQLYRKALSTSHGTAPEDRQRAARTLLRLAAMVRQKGDAGESDRLYREAIAAHRAAFPSGDPSLAHALLTFGIIVRNDGRWAEAEPLLREAYEIRRQAQPADHRATGVSAVYLGQISILLNHFSEAEPLLREAITEHQLAIPPDEWAIALARVELGRDLSSLGRRTEAEAELLAAAGALESTNEIPYAASALGAFYTDWDQMEPGKGYDAKAREWFLKSVKGFIRPIPVAERANDE